MSLCIVCKNAAGESHCLCSCCISSWCDSFNRKKKDFKQSKQTSERLISSLKQIVNSPSTDRFNELEPLLNSNNILQCIDYSLSNQYIEQPEKNLLIEILGELVLRNPSAKTNFYQLISYDQPLLLLASSNSEFIEQLKNHRDELLNEAARLKHRKKKCENFKSKLKKLKTEMIFLEILTTGMLLGGFSFVLAGMDLQWFFALVIIILFLFIGLKTTRYKGINLDFTYQPYIRYRIDNLNVNPEYLNSIENKTDRINKLIVT